MENYRGQYAVGAHCDNDQENTRNKSIGKLVNVTVEKGEYSRGNKYSAKVAVFSERFQEKATEYYLFT